VNALRSESHATDQLRLKAILLNRRDQMRSARTFTGGSTFPSTCLKIVNRCHKDALEKIDYVESFRRGSTIYRILKNAPHLYYLLSSHERRSIALQIP
jgi:hypothetical protein